MTKGIGTQQLVSILQDLLPDARIARADLDTTKKKDTWAETVKNFEKGEIDILVGTKSITKGYHFPGVALVGVIWGDLHAHLPSFNAAEECLQQLIQVAGRAGREHPESTVIIQVMHDSSMFDFIDETKYIDFAQQEITERQAALYPPFCRLVNIEIRHRLIQQVDHDAAQLASFLRQVNDEGDFALKILGPTVPSLNKIQDIHIRHLFLKTKTLVPLENLLTPDFLGQFRSSIFVQPI